MILSEYINSRIVKRELSPKEFSEVYDVIVVGLGTAGSIAAIIAAQKGLKVLGLERFQCMGGTGTAGAVLGYYFGSKGGIYEDIDAEVSELNGKFYTSTVGINPEAKKYVMERWAIKNGVHINYETTIIGVFMEGNTVIGVRWIGPEGIREAGCKVVIDCTAEAEAAFLAGCETRIGREIDAQTQPFSSVKVCIKDGSIRNLYDDCGYVDQKDGIKLSNAIIESNSLHIKEKYDDKERLLYLAPLLGIREGRLIVGEENVSLKDYLNDKVTDKPVFYAYSNIDNHGKDVAFESEIYQDWTVVGSLWGINISVPIPLGALIPRGYNGILVAGRSIAVDHDIAACVRQKRDMQKCGEVAGIAAYLSIKRGVAIKDIPYEELKGLIEETYCLDEENNVKLKETISHNDDLNKNFEWLIDEEEIKEGLASIKPGIAIWSARRLNGKIADRLYQWMREEQNQHLKKNSALSLALIGDKRAIPVLREIVRQRDPFVPETSRKYNQVRGYTAIYLLGKLRDAEITQELLTIIADPKSVIGDEWHSGGYCDSTEFIADSEEYYFQYFAHSVMALLKIGKSHKNLRTIIAKALTDKIERRNFSLSVTLKGPSRYKYSMTDRIKNIIYTELETWNL